MIRRMLVLALSASLLAQVDLEHVSSLNFECIGVAHANDARLFLVDQGGRIRIYNGTLLATPFLDISGIISGGSERGLLGLAFHPQYATNGFFYVDYTNTAGDTVIARYQVSGDPNIANPGSASILLTVDQPFSNHNGGQIEFGPDGYLYISLGDGGSGGDPECNGQDLSTLLGAILRIDVDGGSPYAIPPSNPFVGMAGAQDEIWAWGLRNPWRFSFDRMTGDLYIADVGQNNWEEVNMQPAASSGGENYGWNMKEGFSCFNCTACPTCDCGDMTLVDPVLNYAQGLECSVTGGYVYRGSLISSIVGDYLFSDYCTGDMWFTTPGVWTQQTLPTGPLGSVTTYGQDACGEVYVVDTAGGGSQLYRFVTEVLSDLYPGWHSAALASCTTPTVTLLRLVDFLNGP